jgi:hypothetical protein
MAMARQIEFSEVEEAPEMIAFSAGSSAALLESANVTLRFRLTATDDSSLEALRYARRSMLREERTRGVVEDEPSLEHAVFSAFDVVWEVPAQHRKRCRAKLEELGARANCALAASLALRRS